MGFAVPITAALIGAGGSIGSSLIGRMGRGGGAQQADLIKEQLATARQARSQGESLFSTGHPLLQQAASHYSKLLGGDPRALREAVAPEASGIRETFLGAERGLNYGPLRGGRRDVAQAELARTKAAKLGDLIPTARRDAAQAGASLGLGAVGAGQQGVQGAGGLFGQLAGQGESARQFNAQGTEGMFEGIGETVASGLQSKGGGAKKPVASTTSAPLMGGGGGPYGPPVVREHPAQR